jgi:HK97 family phage prohead protease
MKQVRAYSVLTIKSMDDEKRVLRGVATTPSTDSYGDIVEPKGASFKLPIPFLWQHDAHQPIGHVTKATVTKEGIEVEVQLVKFNEPGKLKDRLDEAWQSIKAGLVRGLSIGFSSIEHAYLKETQGIHFVKWLWHELSAVTIAANAECSVTAIKSIDQEVRAALGRNGSSDPPPGVSGTKQPAASGFFNARKKDTMKSLNEQINDLRELRTQKAARMNELNAESGGDFSDEQAAEFDGLKAEVKSLDNQVRAKEVEAMNASAARAVEGHDTKSASASRGPTILVRKTDPDDKFKGQGFVRGVRAKWLANTYGVTVGEVADNLYGKTNPNLVRWIKASVAGGGTGSGEWGAELAEADSRYTGDFIEYLHGMTVFDRLPLRVVPHNVDIKGQDGAATGYWVGQSKAIPVSAADFSTVELTALDVGALCVVSNRLLRDSSPAAEALLRDALAEASAQRVDTTFLGAGAASAGVSPAGILNGVTAVQASGTDAAAIRADIQSLYAAYFSNKNASGIQLIMTPSMAKAIALLVNSLGQTEFPGLNSTGGMLLGDTVWTGDNVTAGNIIAIKPSDVWRIGDSGVQVSMTREATIEMTDAPAGASDTPVAMASHTVSMFQSESTAFKVVRQINYQKRRTHAVQFIENAEYGGVVS